MKIKMIMGLLLILPWAAQAQVQKWVDADGNVHYSDRPPAGTVKDQKLIRVPTAPSPSAAEGASSGPKSFAEKELEFRKRRIEADEAQKKADLAEKEQKERQDNCTSARNRLRSLEDGGRTYSFNEKGERVYMDNAARETEMANARSAVAHWCAG